MDREEQPLGTQRGHRLEHVPLDQRYCNQCGDLVRDEGGIGDLWWDGDPAGDGTATIICRDCA
jgi:hypothetical protein